MTSKRKRTPESPYFQRFLIISLVIQYFWFLLGELALFNRFSPWTVEQFFLFSGLYGIFLILHGFARVLCRTTGSTIGYVIVQSSLIFALSVVGDSGELRQWLFLPVLGELVIFSGSLWFAIFTAALMFGFSIVQGYIEFGNYMMKVGDVYVDGVLLSVGYNSFWWALGQTPYLVALLLQLWERRRAVNLLNELDIAHRQLAEYAVQVEKLTLTNERTRMARELHDTLAQGLTGTILQLEALEAYLDIGDSSKASTIAAQAKKRARAALADSRRAIDDLRLQPLEQMPLPELIEHEVKRFSDATGIAYTLDVLPILSLSEKTNEHLLRCVSEALSNIARHAKATHIELSIIQKGDNLDVELTDNGVGFDVETASKPGHYGLMGMRERVRLLGGTFEVSSKIGVGTHLHFGLKANS